MPASARFRPPRTISWSPTGDHLFIQLDDSAEYSSGLGGQATQLSPGRGAFYAPPAFLGWFPDGQRMLLQGGFGQIYMADLNGSDLQDIAFGNGLGGALSPNADQLAYLDRAGGLSVIRLDGGVVHQIVRSAVRVHGWSPDGSLVLYTSFDPNFHVVGADGSGDRVLSQRAALTDAFWTAAGIYYRVRRYASPPEHQIFKSYVADPYDAEPRELFPGAHAIGYGTVIQGISGDGKIILYTAESFDSAGLRIFDRAHGIDRSLVRCSGTRQADRIVGSILPDFIDADRGNDVIDVLGGGKDTVTCGPGRDLVRADRDDRIGRSCERVIRRP